MLSREQCQKVHVLVTVYLVKKSKRLNFSLNQLLIKRKKLFKVRIYAVFTADNISLYSGADNVLNRLSGIK